MSPRRLTLLALTAALAAAPSVARADTTPQQAIADLNVQRQANGIPPVTENDSLATWCPDEDNSAGISQTADNSTVVDGWSPTTSPWDAAPLHQFDMYNPQHFAAGSAEADGWTCLGFDGEAGSAQTPTAYAFVSDAGPDQVPPAETADYESPFTPGQLVGIPQGTTTGPNLLLYVIDFDDMAGSFNSQGLRASSASLVGPSGPVAIDMVDSTGQWQGQSVSPYFPDGGVMIPTAPLQPDTSYNGQVTWVNAAGATFSQTFSFTTASSSTSPGTTPTTPSPPTPAPPNSGRPSVKRARLQILSVTARRHRLRIRVRRTATARGTIRLYVASIGPHGPGHYRAIGSSRRTSPTFTIGLGPGRWALQARLSANGWAPARATRRVSIPG